MAVSTQEIEAGSSGPRTQRGSRSRESIRVAARRAFRDVGYAGARVSDIAEDAGFSNGAFYRYFADKEAVMLSLLEDLLADAIVFAHAPWEEDKPAESIYVTTERYLNFYSDNADLFRVLVEASQSNAQVEEIWAKARDQVVGRVARMIARAKHIGVARSDLDTQMAAVLLVSMTDHYAYLRFILGRVPARSISRASREISTLWAHGAFSRSASPA
jgi:AcrR family transcriptional regulator